MDNSPLTVQEVMKLLRVSSQTIYTLCRAGKLPHFKVGNKLRFHKADILALTNTTKGEVTHG
jgi:excisionase family DNA binding protein